MFLLIYLLFVITYALSSYVCFIIDMTYSKTRIDGMQANKLLILYQKYLPCVAFNVIVLPIPSIYLVSSTFPIISRSLTIYNFLTEMILTYFLADFLFYILHRILHIQSFYKHIHYIHHRVRNPIGMAALYAHPLEIYMGNIFPLFLPAYLIMTNTFTFCVWMFAIIVETVITSHSSYQNMSEFHDNHHKLYRYNYGLDIFMDRLFGTRI